MAKLIDGKFILEIRPEYNVNHWVEYYFSFNWDSKPIFNPEVLIDDPIQGDEMNERLVSLFEEAVDCKEDEKVFTWGSDDPDIYLEIKVNTKNPDGELFSVEVFFNEIYFRNGNNRSMAGNVGYGENVAGIKALVWQKELKQFAKELRNEFELSKSKTLSIKK